MSTVMVKDVKRVLYNLNRHKGKAAEYLVRNRYTGKLWNSERCVISNYISAKLPGVEAVVGSYDVLVYQEAAAPFTVDLPKWVAELRERFDDGEYTELKEE